MGLTGTIQGLVTTAFDTIGDLKSSVTITYLVSIGAYDPTTDAETQTTALSSNIQVLFTNFTFSEVDASSNSTNFKSIIVETDMKVLIDASKLSGNVPKPNDVLLETATSIEWTVMGVKTVPGKSLYILHVRKT